jgi:hypothetical protein
MNNMNEVFKAIELTDDEFTKIDSIVPNSLVERIVDVCGDIQCHIFEHPEFSFDESENVEKMYRYIFTLILNNA